MDTGVIEFTENGAIAWAIQQLRAMNTTSDNPWRPGISESNYRECIQYWGGALVKQVIDYAINHEMWRPSVAKLNEIAARFYNPAPTADVLFVEFWHKAQTVGYTRPNWQHALLDDIVQSMGGWMPIYRQNAHIEPPDSHGVSGRERMYHRFLAAYKQCARQWQEDVIEQLRLSYRERAQKWKPIGQYQYVPPRLLHPESERLKLLPAPPAGFAEVLACAPSGIESIEEVKEKLRAGTRKMQAGTPEMDDSKYRELKAQLQNRGIQPGLPERSPFDED